MNPIFHGSVTGGVLYLDDVQAYEKQIASLDGKPVELILRRRREKRSNQANAYYWSVVIPLIAEYCGYERYEAHAALKMKFLRSREDGALPSVRSTADLSTAEFAEYVDQCRRLGAELGVNIPDPGQAE